MPNLLDVAQRNLFRQRHDYVPAIRNCCLAILVALLLFLTQRHLAFGVMAVVPLFVKQNIGLLFLGTVVTRQIGGTPVGAPVEHG